MNRRVSVDLNSLNQKLSAETDPSETSVSARFISIPSICYVLFILISVLRAEVLIKLLDLDQTGSSRPGPGSVLQDQELMLKPVSC